MVELRCACVSVGLVVGGRGSPWCRQPVGHRSRIDPCMSGWFDVGRLASGLFTVASLLPQLFGWCLGMSSALWSACASLVSFCCCRRCRILSCCVDDVCAVGSFVRRSACARPVMVSCSGLGAGSSKLVVLVGWSVVEVWNLGVPVCSWVWLPAGVAQHVVANPWDAVPVSTLACLDRWVLAGLRAVCSLSGRFSAAVWSVPSSVSRLAASAPVSLLSSRFVLRFAVAGLSGVVDALRPGGARCVVLVRRCRGHQWLARFGLCGGPYGPSRPCLVAVAVLYVSYFPSGMLFSWFDRFRDVCACGCCVVASTLVSTPSSSPPNGRLVLRSDAPGPGGRVGSVPVVPVALGHRLPFDGASPPHAGVCPQGEKSSDNWYKR